MTDSLNYWLFVSFFIRNILYTGVVFSGLSASFCVLPWSTDDVHIAYHDNEWGVPVYDDK